MTTRPVSSDEALALARGVMDEISYVETDADADYHLGVMKGFNRALMNASVIKFEDWKALDIEAEAILRDWRDKANSRRAARGSQDAGE